MLRVYTSDDEVLIFETNAEDYGKGEHVYFKGEEGDEGDRDREDYDCQLMRGGVQVTSRLRVDGDRA